MKGSSPGLGLMPGEDAQFSLKSSPGCIQHLWAPETVVWLTLVSLSRERASSCWHNWDVLSTGDHTAQPQLVVQQELATAWSPAGGLSTGDMTASFLPAGWIQPESRALSVLNLASSHTPFALPFLLCRLHSRTWPRGPSHSTPHCKPMRRCRVQHRVEMW